MSAPNKHDRASSASHARLSATPSVPVNSSAFWFAVRVHRWRIAAGAAVVVTALAGAVMWLVASGGSDDDLRADLVAEFGDTYGSEPPGTGDVTTVELVAAPSVAQVLPGQDTDVWAFNGTVPGPSLRIPLGETIRIELDNQLPETTTIHWHGIRVPNAMDGVPGVTQDPVEPGSRHSYEFTPPDAGTFWYHSHTNGSEQLERGLYGSLVVTDPTEPGWSQDIEWVIDDWLLTDTGQIDPDFNTASDVEHNGRWGDTVTVNGSTGTALTAQPGERIRLRLINASNGRIYAPRFGALDASVTAVDGLPARQALPADGFVIAPGNRIDVDLTIPDQPGTYPVVDDFTGDIFDLATINVAGELVATPDFAPPLDPDLPVWADAIDLDVDREYRLDIRRGEGRWEWTMNDRAYPDVDNLEIEAGSFAKIRLTNDSQLLHPMHLHGQFFKVISRNGQPIDEGHFRDTVLLYPGDQIDIGLVGLDAGTWAFHCHIQEHADAGMMTLVEVSERT